MEMEAEQKKSKKTKKRLFWKDFLSPESERTWEMVRQFLEQHRFSTELGHGTKGTGHKIRRYHTQDTIIAEVGQDFSSGEELYKIRVYYYSTKKLSFLTKAN